MSDEHELIGEVVSDRYEVKRHLGDGSMGIVFLAEHTHMKKPFALKIMRPEVLEQPTAVERFQREAQAAGHIDHPHVCAASDFGKLADGRWFLVMEYLEGRTLGDLLADEERLSAERATAITLQIASGLQRAHELGVVHRDLKPENIILIDREGNSDFVKISDFGVARVEVVDEQKLTQAGTTMGTPIYMSPEQARAKKADARSDLYSLGIMVFEMLVGQVPFYSQSLAVILSMHTKEQPPSMGDLAPEAMVPIDLQRIVSRLLEKDPADRFQSAGELIDALEAANLAPYVAELDTKEPVPTSDDAPPYPETAKTQHVDVVANALDTPSDPMWEEALVAEPGEEKETVADLVPVGAVELPSAQSPISRGLDWFQSLAIGKQAALIAAVVGVFTVPVFLSLLAASAGDGEEREAEVGEAMAFSVDDVSPADLAEERKDFLEDHDLDEKLPNAAPAEALALLEPIEADEEQVAHRAYLLGTYHSEAGNTKEAMKHYAAAVEADRRYASDSKLETDAYNVFRDKTDDGDDARALVTAMLAADPSVRDDVFGIVVDGSWKVRKRAEEVLSASGELENMAKWKQAAVQLRVTGRDCEKVKALVEEIASYDAPEAIPVLEKASKRSTSGCGLFKKGDCYKCMRPTVKKEIARLEKLEK